MILSVENIHKSYGKAKVLKGISFTIDSPKIIALVGPNGSGKSTLLNILTNLIQADKGSINILDKSNQNPIIFQDISFMQDNTVLYDYLTGYDHLQFIGDVQNLSKEHILKKAEKIGITSYLHKKVRTYSLGMKQHLLLTMAILNDPKLLILDEPLNGLDPTSAIKVRELLIELHANGTTILLSSHNLGEIDRVTSTILFLKDGLLIKEDMTAYESVRYEIQVSDILAAYDLLQQQSISAEIINDKISFHQSEHDLSQVVRLLDQNNISLLDIEKKVFGSEERYKKIFQSEEQV